MYNSIPPRPSGAARLYPRATREEWVRALAALETVSGQQQAAREMQPKDDRVKCLSPKERVDKMLANVSEAECLSLHGMTLQEYKVKMVTQYEKDEKDRRDTNKCSQIKRRRALRDPVAREKLERMQSGLKEMLKLDFIVPFGKSVAMRRRIEQDITPELQDLLTLPTEDEMDDVLNRDHQQTASRGTKGTSRSGIPWGRRPPRLA
jgi:hypothetical protein